MTGLDRALDGITVVSLEQAVAAPYCGLLLADAGARIIKVERPDGDFARGYDAGANGESTIFAWLNRGKQSVCLDLKDKADLGLVKRMINDADVLLSNLAPGALGRLGLDAARLRETNKGLITCAISGYGGNGDDAHKKAYDFLMQGEVGLSAVTGTADAPARVGLPIADLSTGLTAYAGILRALIQRGRTGVGVDLDIAMFDVLADWMNMPLLTHRYGGGAPERMGLKHTFIAPYGAFGCGDGGQVLLSVQSDREFAVFCQDVLQQPELATDARFKTNPLRFENRMTLDRIVTDAFGDKTIAQVTTILDAARIANARLNSVADLSEHPNLRNAATQFGGMPVSMADLPLGDGAEPLLDAPKLGADTAAIRAEFASGQKKGPAD